MDNVDASEHYSRDTDEPPPSFLTIILDTNPSAWAYLSATVPLAQVTSAILVFINAHLAFNQANKVAVIASHVDRAEYLYPPPDSPTFPQHHQNGALSNGNVEMTDAPPTTNGAASHSTLPADDANFYRPFATISASLTRSLKALLTSTPSPSLTSATTTSLAGALTLALSQANKLLITLNPNASSTDDPTVTAANATSTAADDPSGALPPALTSRILILSASPASPSQYIPLMNTIFASAKLCIPIDVLALTPYSSPFLQQAAATTNGLFLNLQHPHGLLQTLMQAFLASPPSRNYLIPATESAVDFRAACFCHRRVVDMAFVCSICLSIFCEPPAEGVCWTCQTVLSLGDYGRKPVVVMRGRKRKKRDKDREGRGTPGLA